MKLTPAPRTSIPTTSDTRSSPGLYSIDGGRMDGFNCVPLGEDMTGYTQFDRSPLPVYWALADRFVLADHFFTSMFGPTFPEHLYTVAAQSLRHRRQQDDDRSPRQLLRRPHRVHEPVPDRGPHRHEGHQHDHEPRGATSTTTPANLFKIARRTGCTRRTCINIKMLPDELEKAGIELEVLRQHRPVDERAAGDPARAVRSGCGARCSRPRRS